MSQFNYSSCHTSHNNRLTKAHTYPPTNKNQTYAIAHTAKCKLNMAANHPDRNLRFVLGHAFTLDNVLLRIVEIENQSAKEEFAKPAAKGTDADTGARGSLAGRRVSFSDNNARPSHISTSTTTTKDEPSGKEGRAGTRAKSPPPSSRQLSKSKPADDDQDTSSDDYDEVDDDDDIYNRPSYSDEENDQDEDGGGGSLGLTRFASASAQPPRTIPSTTAPELAPSSESDSDSDDDDKAPPSPPALPSDVDVRQVLRGAEDAELGELYEAVRGCPCHGGVGGEGVKSGGIWDVTIPGQGDGEGGGDGRRVAVMRVEG